MPSFVERTWEGDPNAFGGRRARRGFSYQAYVPAPIATLAPMLSAAVVCLAFWWGNRVKASAF